MKFTSVLVFSLAIIFASSASGVAEPEKNQKFMPVLELFTSQGCSSCPPADRHLGDLQERDDLIALSLPVDYWDYKGWQDTLARPENAIRQRLYAKMSASKSVYTPQVVVNGVTHAVGSRPYDVKKAIKQARAQLADRFVSVRLHMNGNKLVVKTDAAAKPGERATIWLALISKVQKVKIKRGENRGKVISYYNVVRDLKKVGEWNGAAQQMTVPAVDLAGDPDSCAILIQDGPGGAILGAAMMRSIGS